MMFIENKYEFGDIVYLTTDPEQKPRMVVKFIVAPGSIIYGITMGEEISHHYDMELSYDKVIV